MRVSNGSRVSGSTGYGHMIIVTIFRLWVSATEEAVRFRPVLCALSPLGFLALHGTRYTQTHNGSCGSD